MPHSWIDLDGLANMRDLGGTPVAGGGRVQPGRLIRSDALHTLTPQDVTALVEQHGVTDVIDLRSETEQHLTGPGPLVEVESLTHHHHSLFAPQEVTMEQALALPWARRERSSEQRLPRDGAHWSRHYLGYLAARPDSVSGALRAIAGARGAAVVHCAAGKDRTGTVVALALTVAGVAQDDVVADYLATAERVERVVERMSTMRGYDESLRGRPMSDHQPAAEAITSVLASVQETSGSVPQWLVEQGWTPDEVEGLRARLTDPA